MKYTGNCTKCNSDQVIEVKGTRFNSYQYVYLNNWGTKYVILDRYVCSRCGFTEEYAQLDEKSRTSLEELLVKNGSKKDEGFV